MKKRILIIDDEKTICLSLMEGLKDLGYEVDCALDAGSGIKKAFSFKPHVIFLDMRLGNENGLDLLKKIKNIDNDTEVVIMTAYGNIETAVAAIKYGAFDYIKKPFDFEEIDIIISKALDNFNMKKKIYLLEKEKGYGGNAIIGNSFAMKEIHQKIDILSKNDNVTVLIRGETGTGKELVAEAIHNKSVRRDGAMVKINCGAIPKDLVESELFGYEKNAFTGAASRKKGLFEIADGGTVFLDELGEIPLRMQTKLLRFLEERRFKRVGGLQDIDVDIRIIAATNKNLEDAIKEKKFREDLYYRLNVIPINLPPLRDRMEDIILLGEYFLDIYNKKFNKSIKGFNNKVKDKFLAYNWPGNVRELNNVIERIVILYNIDFIDICHLPSEIQNYNEDINRSLPIKDLDKEIFDEEFCLEDKIQKIEKRYITIALDKAHGNYSRAARLLGISRFALKRRVKKYFE
ncbi:sigma-54-dependent transcriptional regulator [Paramaledivibacter caminithermalis]|jgi:two-component system response regulator AtoC|uniref:Stage 0 sporulation protein A homolog n=1 Tax=Paramaledivibacter caminithermalis (strain DSM 15212 / CIP 107654 / DViRD3) TaxID=1121301 RepID=A0A1M6LJX0_PARC5|nr:sigma-54 dependent transcriptional regulator [Paramaledivibacter caminithermalis]SHJ71470.1 two-component system, NtrC family, response regulator AtoC [Paramaledivibacter caminithermalis DSM 15212]